MKTKKIIFKSLIIAFVFAFIFTLNKTEAASFSCQAEVDTRADTANIFLGVVDGNLIDYVIGILQVGDDDPRNATKNPATHISGDKLVGMYHLSLLDRGTNYRVLIFGKVAGKYIIELPGCQFITPASNDGACGSAKGGSFTSEPTAGLCSSGVATNVSEVGNQWSWRCNGQNGSTINASCSASIGSVSSGASTSSNVGNSGLVPKCNTGELIDGEYANPCDFNYLMRLINNVIDFLLFTIATPLAALVFAYAGFLLITAGGDPAKSTKAKTMMKNLLIGYLIALAAWLIINTILMGLGFDGSFLVR